ncbi:MAG TPA: hypothetical protein VFF69_15745 [Phycisphaerales bacterium]|nr:hypothetical protein [Phycisphaerales bacterium]
MRRLTHVCAAVLTAAAGLAAPALAQDGPRPFLTFEHDGLAEAFVDERDMALRDALAMLPDRLAELPEEIEEMPPEAAQLAGLFLRTIAKPSRVGVTYDGTNPSGGFYGYGVIISVECRDEGEAADLQEAVLGVTEMVAEEEGVELPLEASERFEGMSEIMLPLGPISFGPREAETGWRYEIIIGTMNDPDGAFAGAPDLIAEPGFESYATATLDFSTLTPLSRMAVNMAGANAPQVREFVARFEEMGLVGEDALRLEYQAGNTPEAAVQTFALRDAAPRAEALSLATEPLAGEHLKVVPADAFAASISTVSFAQVDGLLAQLTEHGVPVADAIAGFEEQTGVHLVEDVLHALGGTAAFYNAESTGGGSLLSSVLLLAIEDRERFSEALQKLTDFANDAIDSSGDPGRYVQFERWTAGEGIDLLSLRFPGLPVPLEVTFALADDWLIAGLTPQAAAAAARQATGDGDGGLPSNPRFAAAFEGHEKGVTAISFVDPAETLDDGYWLLSLGASAVSNLVRSPHEPESRDPGMILPLYRDLAGADIRPTLQITSWEGEDMVTRSWSDRCLWVQAGGVAGVGSAFLPLVGAGIGAAAIAGQRDSFGAIDVQAAPWHIYETTRRAVVIDPIAAATRAMIAVYELESSAGRLGAWPAPAE